MARCGLLSHRKFLRLVRLLETHGQICPAALAAGVLELLWDPAYQAADDWIGVAEDVELRIGWRGPVGVLCAALCDAGFIDYDPERGGFRVHDLWEHAPSHVKERAERNAKRTLSGRTLSQVRSDAGRAGVVARLALTTKSRDLEATAEQMESGCRPSPSKRASGEGRGGDPDPEKKTSKKKSGADAPDTRAKGEKKHVPLAFPVGRAIDALRKCPRIVLPARYEKKHIGILQALINLAGTPEALERLGAWLLAGAEKHRDVIGLEELRTHGGTWLAASARSEASPAGESFYEELT